MLKLQSFCNTLSIIHTLGWVSLGYWCHFVSSNIRMVKRRERWLQSEAVVSAKVQKILQMRTSCRCEWRIKGAYCDKGVLKRSFNETLATFLYSQLSTKLRDLWEKSNENFLPALPERMKKLKPGEIEMKLGEREKQVLKIFWILFEYFCLNNM